MRMMAACVVVMAAMIGSASAKNACVLLSQDDAAMVLGQKVDPGQSGDGSCIYNASNAAGHSLIITVTDFGDAAKSYFDMTASPTDPGNSPVPGLSDEAVFTDAGGIVELRMRKGGTIISLQLDNSVAADPKAALLKAGQKASAQL